jgi:uncharacterized membrane protein YqjE
MRKLLSTRHGFFALAALVCWSLLVVIDPEFRWVAVGTGCLYFLLSVLFLAEDLGRSSGIRQVSPRKEDG